MNSDTPPPGLPPASPTPAPPRSSNLKGRWKRGPNPVTGAAAVQRPTAPANFGEVKDIATVKESLSGSNPRGYEGPTTAPAPTTTYAPAPVAPPPAALAPRTESYAPRPTAPTAPAPRPAAANPPPTRPAPPAPSAEYIALREAQRAEARMNPRPPQAARPPQQPRPPQDNRGSQHDGRGSERENFVALKPDPANDPAPRRLRTESARPVPVEEYSPSNFGRVPDKSVPTKHEHRSDRDRHTRQDRPSDKREAAPSSSGERPKPNATISARVSSGKEGKAKSGGIFGFIKKIFGDSKKERKLEKSSSSLREEEDEPRRTDDENDGADRRSHHQGSQGRHGDNRRGGQRRSQRR